MVWACIEKRRRIRRQESDGDGGGWEKKERKTEAEVVGSIKNDLSERESCQGRKRKIALNGGISEEMLTLT